FPDLTSSTRIAHMSSQATVSPRGHRPRNVYMPGLSRARGLRLHDLESAEVSDAAVHRRQHVSPFGRQHKHELQRVAAPPAWWGPVVPRGLRRARVLPGPSLSFWIS